MPETRRSNSARRASKEYPPSMFDGSSSMRPQTCRSWALVSKYRKLASSPLKRCMSRVYVRHFGHRAPSSPSHDRSEEHTSELQSRFDLVCCLLREKKKQ